MKKFLTLLLVFVLLLSGCQSEKDIKTPFLTEFFTSGSEERYTAFLSRLSDFQAEESHDEEALEQIALDYHEGISSMVSASCLDDIILGRKMERFDQLAADSSTKIIPEKITFKSIDDSSWNFQVTLKSTGNEKYTGGVVKGQIKVGKDGLISSLWIASLNKVLKKI